jgi:hypothetical protein
VIRILAVFLIGLLVLAIVGGAYYAYVGFAYPISVDGEHWNYFGGFFGGVAGTLLTFISILLLVYTVHLQTTQLSDTQHETLKRDSLAHVNKADNEIEHWLQRKLAASAHGETVEFGDVVWGIIEPSYVNAKEFGLAVVRLHRLTCLYCEALALYRDNINPYFIFKYHRQKAESLLEFLRQNQRLLGQMAGPSLEFCQMHLDGRHEQA